MTGEQINEAKEILYQKKDLWTRPMIIGKIFISKNQGCLLKTILEKN